MMHYTNHNQMTSAHTQRRRSLERLHNRHHYLARTYQDGSGRHRRMAEHYARELRAMGVPA